MAFELTASIVERLQHEPGADFRAWVEQLPQVVGKLADRWSLRLDPPYQPGGSCSWVAPARDLTGRGLALKVGWLHEEAASEADGLRAWRGRGAVLLHDAHVAGPTAALLLERCCPGTPLGAVLPEPEQDVVIASLLPRLWIRPPAGHRFRPLQAMCDSWVNQVQERRGAGPTGIDPGVARAGLELFRSLPASAEREVLLCTDLHAGNVLAGEREPWLAIDPKPHLGDPTYDPLQHLLNCEERLTVDPVGLVSRMAGLLDLDRERLGHWLFARCVLESVDRPALAGAAARLAPG